MRKRKGGKAGKREERRDGKKEGEEEGREGERKSQEKILGNSFTYSSTHPYFIYAANIC